MTYIIALICSALLLAADQLSKYYFLTNYVQYQSEPVINGILNFTYHQNTGGAFGIFKDQQWLLLAITSIMFLVLIYMLIKKKFRAPLLNFSVCLILAGGFGNMIDRIFRGFVVDFIDLQFVHFAIFNIADICVVVGAGLIILYFILDIVKDYRSGKRKPAKSETDA